METKELIALFLVTGIIAVGVSLPLNRYLFKTPFWLCCLLFVGFYSFLVSKQVYINPNWSDVAKQSFATTNSLTYMVNGVVAVLYVITAVACSFIYEKMRADYKISSLTWTLSRWWGIVIWIVLATLLYYFSSVGGGSVIFFSTLVGLFATIAIMIVISIIPMVITTIAIKKL